MQPCHLITTQVIIYPFKCFLLHTAKNELKMKEKSKLNIVYLPIWGHNLNHTDLMERLQLALNQIQYGGP